jgi:hypothetical protein
MGIINFKGEWVLKPTFEIILPQYNRDDKNPLYRAVKDIKWGFINHNGKWVIPDNFENLNDFSDGLAGAKQGGKWGYIDKSGAWKIKPEYDDVWDFDENFAKVEKDGKWGFIDRQGTFVKTLSANNEELSVHFLNEMGKERIIVDEKDGKFGFTDENDGWVIAPEFDDFSYFSDGYAAVKKIINGDL